MLDTCNEMHLFCLHLVYLDLINEALDEFSDEWNNQYTLITETNFSPRQLWVSGIICNQSCTAVPAMALMKKVQSQNMKIMKL